MNAISHQTLNQWGQRFGIRYCLDDTPAGAWVASGQVHDVRLLDSLHLTLSNLDIERGYTSSSCQSVPWFVSVVLSGSVSLTLGEQTRRLGPGEGFCASLAADRPLVVHQPRQRQLQTVNLAVLDTAPLGLPAPSSQDILHTWALPTALHRTLCDMAHLPAGSWRQRLTWQGLALQLLGIALPDDQATAPAPGLSPPERARLTALHERIRHHPGAEYRLATLASDAAMSTSSLRQKFRRLYGYTLFEHIRRCRLEQARRLLAQGQSVQQVAHACGFKHATNFATAFKRAFGVTPHTSSLLP